MSDITWPVAFLGAVGILTLGPFILLIAFLVLSALLGALTAVVMLIHEWVERMVRR